MNFAIIVAAGKGKRFGSPGKIFSLLLNKPFICHTIKKFQDCGLIDEIVVVAQKNDFSRINEIKKTSRASRKKVSKS